MSYNPNLYRASDIEDLARQQNCKVVWHNNNKLAFVGADRFVYCRHYTQSVFGPLYRKKKGK
jgi:hypothetical protein